MSTNRLALSALAFGALWAITGSAVVAKQGVAMHADAAELIAINVLIEPDAATQAQARALNARLRESAPHGFALDDSHFPHISILHRFVRTRDLEQVYAAVDEVVERQRTFPWQLTAMGIDAGPWGNGTMVSIGVRKTPELESLQRELVKAVGPYAVENADASAFVRTPDSASINSETIAYVTTFVPKRIGEPFKPHVTIGLASAELARTLQDEGFPERTFSGARVAIYQLGNDGTARKRLWPR